MSDTSVGKRRKILYHPRFRLSLPRLLLRDIDETLSVLTSAFLAHFVIMPLLHTTEQPEAIDGHKDTADTSDDGSNDDGRFTARAERSVLDSIDVSDGRNDTSNCVHESGPKQRRDIYMRSE